MKFLVGKYGIPALTDFHLADFVNVNIIKYQQTYAVIGLNIHMGLCGDQGNYFLRLDFFLVLFQFVCGCACVCVRGCVRALC